MLPCYITENVTDLYFLFYSVYVFKNEIQSGFLPDMFGQDCILWDVWGF